MSMHDEELDALCESGESMEGSSEIFGMFTHLPDLTYLTIIL